MLTTEVSLGALFAAKGKGKDRIQHYGQVEGCWSSLAEREQAELQAEL